jgi:hypothetical protein
MQKAGTPADLEQTTKRAEAIAKLEEGCASALGLRDSKLASHMLTQALNVPNWCDSESDPERFTTALETLKEIGPKGATQLFLAIQMIGVHKAALMFLKRATVEGQTVEGTDANVLRAVRLMRLFNEQLEAMARLKGTAGRQKVTVEHVHVHQGGQAIVGSVTAGTRTKPKETC